MPFSARARRALSVLLAAMFVPALLATSPGSSASASAEAAPADDGITFTAAEPLLDQPLRGREAIRELGDKLGVAAARNELRAAELRTLLRTDETAWVDGDGDVLYVEPPVTTSAPTVSPATPMAPLAETFELHSNPAANLTILLDFDGATVSGTEWNNEFDLAPGEQPAWDPSGDGAGFSDVELAKIQQIWAYVAEDYAPFDVDVTTQDPGEAGLLRSSGVDSVYGTRVLVSPSEAAVWQLCDGSCGGIAYLDVFDAVGGAYQPVWVFPQNLVDNVKYIAEASSHEAGHTLGLDHDGTYWEGDYYTGHDVWAPIMGVGYYKPLVQWSQGSYPDATNSEDDVSILTDYLGARADEASGASSNPSTLPGAPAVVGTPYDTDAYLLGACAPGNEVQVVPAAVSPNLDLRAVLYDGSGVVQLVSEPAVGSAAALEVPAGEGWVLEVDGVGAGTWDTWGYDDYGSLGAYEVSVAGCDGASVSGVPSAPVDVLAGAPALDSVSLSWSPPASEGDGPVTGYVVSRSGSATTQTLGADARSHTFTGLASSTTYQLSVRAVNATGAGPSTTVNVKTQTVPPRAPSIPLEVNSAYLPEWDVVQVWWDEPADPGTKPISGWAIYFDGAYLGELDTEEGAWGADITADDGFPEGDHTVGVAAVSAAGSSPIATVTVTVEHPWPPANDDIADAEVLSGTHGSVQGDNTFATGEITDPVPPSLEGAGGYSVWYSWTPRDNGAVTMATWEGGIDRDTTLAVYTGAPGSLVQVAGDDDSGADLRSWLRYKARAGTRYLIAVDGFDYGQGYGQFALEWSQTVSPLAPGRMAKPTVVVRGRQAIVTWKTAPARPSTLGYLVDISKGKDKSVGATVRKTVFRGLKPGTYRIRVAARNAAGPSPYSAWARIRVR